MQIIQDQVYPNPIYCVENFDPQEDIKSLIDWLNKKGDFFNSEFGIAFDGNFHKFRSRGEVYAFVIDFSMSHDRFDSEDDEEGICNHSGISLSYGQVAYCPCCKKIFS